MKRLFIAILIGLAVVGCAELMRSPSKARAPRLSAIQIANSQNGDHSFAPTDSIFASLHVRNNKGIATVSWRLFKQDIELESYASTVIVTGNHGARFVLRPGQSGFATGNYTIQAEFLIDGKREDLETATFKIALPSDEKH